MGSKTGPDRTRRSLLKAAALVAGAIAGRGGPAAAQALEGRYYYGDPAPPAWIGDGPPPDAGGQGRPPWAGGPGCNPNGNCGGGGNNPCFLRGTRILTDVGYRPIETLMAGDRVMTQFAGAAAIARVDSFTLERSGPRREWIGHQRPVTVRRGALGEGMPHRDLCLTASHAVFVDGFLVPVGNLVNGTSIVFEAAEGEDALDFFHLELVRHDVLDAEGAPCESLRDPMAEPCVPLLGFVGGRSELYSRLRSAASSIVDRRQPIDIIRDRLEERGRDLARAA